MSKMIEIKTVVDERENEAIIATAEDVEVLHLVTEDEVLQEIGVIGEMAIDVHVVAVATTEDVTAEIGIETEIEGEGTAARVVTTVDEIEVLIAIEKETKIRRAARAVMTANLNHLL